MIEGGALAQHAGPVPALLRDCCRSLRHLGFAYAEAWTRERVAIQHDRALQRLQSMDEKRAAEPAPAPETEPASDAEGCAGSSSEQKPNGVMVAVARDETSQQSNPGIPVDLLPDRDTPMRLSTLTSMEIYEDTNAELSHMLSFNGHSAAVRSSFARGGQQLQDLEHFWGSAQDTGYMQNCSIPGICWDNAKVETFDLRRELLLDQSIRDDPRTALAKSLFDVVIGVPVFDVTHKNTVIAVLVFYRLRDSGKDTRGKCYTIHDSLGSFLDKTASIFPLALNLQCSHTSWQAAMQDCKMFEVSHAVEADNQNENSKESTHAGLAQDEEKGASTTAPEKPLSAEERRRRWWKAYFLKWRGQGVNPQPGADVRFSAITGVASMLTLMIIASTDFYMRSNHTYDGNSSEEEVLFAIVGSFAAVIALVFAAPVGPVSQPRAIVWGHIICCAIAVVLDYFTDTYTEKHYVIWPIIPHWFANALVPALGIAAMSYTGTTHPPAAACATVYIADRTGVVKNLGWLFILFPVLFDCAIIIAMGTILVAERFRP